MNTIPYGFFIQLLQGAYITVQLAFCAVLLGLVFGLIGAAAEASRITLIRRIATMFIAGIRGLPELVVIFFVYFGGAFLFSIFLDRYVDVSSFLSGVLALALLFGSYAAQTFRGAFLAIPKGQTEAGRALGLNQWQLFFRVQLPQAWRYALPGLGNLWLVLLKDTALVSLIGLPELMNKAKAASSTTHQPFTYYLIAAVFYLVLTSISQWIMKKMSQRASAHLITES